MNWNCHICCLTRKSLWNITLISFNIYLTQFPPILRDITTSDVSIRVLGFWWWWLFIIPSLRSRRPSGPEKKALDIAFLGTPLISLVAPVATKETEIIWFANLAVTAAAYGYAFFIDSDDDDNKTSGDDGRPAWLKFVFKSLDFGVGRERGARS